ncbi:glutamate ABC transporter substrate-binding protein [Actinomycetospora sp. TBRC 11914]|uniref:glutamate ABC transporter substrate-binding protein n=1 Tax=Actinomycetospora sp. TBRC 11914 TaxID=2729387 RepID=UPI00145D03C0|nr:glutamate ABC transporter substrate-binding protein [Actinomycetospora sp. TBRC 11914]NMO92376.1 glutamate ABC transporter substrate-binding protein [Actinomycetospora sp. TBRC 11914]
MRTRRAGVTAALVVLVVLLAGCSSAAAPPPVVPVRPVPSGTTVLAGAPPAATDTSCGDPAVSLTPTPEPPPGAMPAGTAMARIVARGALIVGIDQSTVPLSYRDPRSGVLTGLDVRIAQEMARAIFGDPNRIRFRIESSAQRIPNLLSGSVDMVVQAMTVTCERKRRIGMSSVYYDAAQRIAVPAVSPVTSITQLGGRPVCSISGTTSITTLQAVRGTNGQPPVVVGVPQNSDCLVLLQQGQVDAATTDDTILAGYALEDRRVAVRGEALASEPYGIGVAPQNTDLLRFTNAVLDRIKVDGTWAAIVAATFGGTPAPPPPGQYAG